MYVWVKIYKKIAYFWIYIVFTTKKKYAIIGISTKNICKIFHILVY